MIMALLLRNLVKWACQASPRRAHVKETPFQMPHSLRLLPAEREPPPLSQSLEESAGVLVFQVEAKLGGVPLLFLLEETAHVNLCPGLRAFFLEDL